MRHKKIIFIGEDCATQITVLKGLESFPVTRFSDQFETTMKEIFDASDVEVTHILSSRIPYEFPNTVEKMREYDAVFISDVSAITLFYHPLAFDKGERAPNLIKLIAEYVKEGGGFCMIGGYMSFAGYAGQGRFHGTALEEILPVNIFPYDDRIEVPEGGDMRVSSPGHPILSGITGEWPFVLGYNKTVLKEGATLVISTETKDPIIATTDCGKGRTVAFTTDCCHHWAPPAFRNWEFYPKLWGNIVNWLSRDI